MSEIRSFSRFGDFPTEIRLLIWEHHFNSFFKSPLIHVLNGGFLSWDAGQSEPLAFLRSITNRGRLLKSLADRYDWHTRDVTILQWKTVIHDLSPVSGKVYSVQDGGIATWPSLQPLINYEAFEVAKLCCKRYQVIDLWLDNTTLNISQPCLVDVVYDVFRIDPGIAKMMIGLNGTPWLARIRRLAIGPFELHGRFDVISILRILDHTHDVEEIYILLSPEVMNPKTCRRDIQGPKCELAFSLVEADVEGQFDERIRELDGPSSSSDSDHVTGDSDYAETLRRVVYELGRRCGTARITYGYLDA
ncbi:hypothetical protein HD806DRAFT_372672 [Xylariaceae sp. AK1471]|nr:hypothetical protein HD806DRAFT_372672 [Xylariaceae sp. AK1471]